MVNIRAVRDLARFKDIIIVFLKYGFDDLIDRFNLPGEFIIRRFTRIKEKLSVTERLRRVLEELGTTFIKLGQVASMRPDLVPEPFVVELIKLQDRVPPVDFAAIREQLVHNLNRDLNEIFSFFDEVPMASASIAQIHRAVLKESGEGVVVKVQRPGIGAVVKTDIEIMEVLARRLHRHSREFQLIDFPGLVQEFKESLMKELDFRREALNMKLFQRNFHDFAHVVAPKVYDEFTSSRVLVMEHISGVKVEKYTGDMAQRRKLAQIGMQAALKSILEDGFFHADPHSGNLLITDDENLCFLDWGMVGRLTQSTRHQIQDIIQSVADQDEEELIRAGMRLVHDPVSDSTGTLERGVLEALDAFYLYPEKKRSMGRFMLDLMELFRRHHIGMPPQLALMGKALLEAEGVARNLYPEIKIIEEVKPYLARSIAARYEPQNVAKRLIKGYRELVYEMSRLPRLVGSAVEKMQSDRLSITLQHQGLTRFTQALENTSNRLSFAIVIAALIIGSSMILVAGVRPLVYGYSLFGILGYFFSAILGIWMVINIMRGRKL